MRTPEFEAALKAWKGTEQEWEAFLEKLPIEEQKKIGNEKNPFHRLRMQGSL